jgi:hypothetical protein
MDKPKKPTNNSPHRPTQLAAAILALMERGHSDACIAHNLEGPVVVAELGRVTLADMVSVVRVMVMNTEPKR